ncbi:MULTISPECIES: hypothetical protein [unclassified Corynebacterium]|nr:MULTISPECIES: hypothetical protein [unclassified Corynebacterium]
MVTIITSFPALVAPNKGDYRPQKGGHMEPPRYRFRPGALDHIMRTRHLDTDEQLAAAIGVKPEDLPRLRAGAMVTARLALKVAALQGDASYLSGYFDPVFDHAAA